MVQAVPAPALPLADASAHDPTPATATSAAHHLYHHHHHHHARRPPLIEDDDIPRTSSTASIPRAFPRRVPVNMADENDDAEDDDCEAEYAEPVPVSESKQLKFLICGAVAGAVSRTCTAPLDRLKVLLQTRIKSAPGGPGTQLTRMALLQDSLCAIYRDGGLPSFWRGNGMNCIKIMPESAIKFYVFEKGKRAMARVQGLDPDDPGINIGMGGRFVAGGIAGLISQFSIYPIETLKTRIMVATAIDGRAALAGNAPVVRASSNALIVETARDMWREGRWRPFFRGLGPSLVGIVPYAGIDFAIFESLKAAYRTVHAVRADPDDPHLHYTMPPMHWLLAFGTLSSSISATSVYPLSLVRTRLQAQGTPGHPERYTGVWDAVRRTYAHEGAKGFYKGLAPTLLKVIPAASISYVCYEWTKTVLGL
ncbi:hypothetical protein AMAG_09667 [Allomyces macrogynus ATCC 38327]|uniref:Uncharacterized protein n=1 Tax=Allomyces macrogynus (strain ATCC 38327) TaxID=578462 RepID=A0A0L0SSX1_ALLM3|nr:hypothetical protein AMAG_09667 [Allomyces macrogynus ATCC 38327]|eukprot:KNE65683.1 hypothetical protein AMAG_09667 [Allomyces macrogynus ATCC 38327]